MVGEKATLVVDTGMGPRNGAVIAQVAKRVSKGPKLYLTTTHFHPEHASGESGFPPGSTLIRAAAQQEEMVKSGAQLIELFASRNAQNAELLKGVTMRAPDETFASEKKLDLGGGVIVRLLWFGPAHSQGDQMIFVDPDKTIVTGDVVQNKTVPVIAGAGTFQT